MRNPGALIASTTFLLLFAAGFALSAGKVHEEPVNQIPGEGPAILWRNPADITTRNLYYGSGGKLGEPQPPFTFVKEVLKGSQPKFEVADANGVHWTVKMGEEARPEIAASRFLWAAGYFTDENYYLWSLQVQGMPRLHRGEEFVVHQDTVYAVRLKRWDSARRSLGSWAWRDGPFVHTREWYGLQVLMAVMNNWDLKDSNNSIFQIGGPHPEQHYVVTDLGSSFGSSGFNAMDKGNLQDYEHSKWLGRVSEETIDFAVPSRPAVPVFINIPEMRLRTSLLWLGRGVPIRYANWMGDLLGRLSDSQIRDAFRGAGYSNAEIDGYSRIIEERIAKLKSL